MELLKKKMVPVGPGQEVLANFPVSGPNVLLDILNMARDWVPPPIIIFYYGETAGKWSY